MMRMLTMVMSPWLVAAPFLLNSVAACESDGTEPQARIAALEQELFEPRLSNEELDGLLQDLLDGHKRTAAARRLVEEGQGQVDRIIAFAARCPDLEARHACADAVEALDAAYRGTEAGSRLGTIYREHTDILLPDYWDRFRKNPDDSRAVAMLMHADPEKIYAWLGAGKDRHDRVRYLALRIRELMSDEFAARHLDEHTAAGLNLALREVCPHAEHLDGPVLRSHAHRVVGHALLKVVSLQSDKEFGHTAEGVLPRIQTVTAYRRWDFFATAVGRWNFHLKVDMYVYSLSSGPSVSPRGTRRGGLVTVEGLYPLVELKLTQDQCMQWILPSASPPWWMEPYVPFALRERLAFSRRGEGKAEPEAVFPPLPEEAAPAPAVEDIAAMGPPATDQFSPEEAAARRKKAETKLKIAQGFRKKAQDRDADEQAALQWLEHAEAAWRMDPTFEEAAYEHCEALGSLPIRHRETHRTAENLARHFTAALQYTERFGVENRSHATMVHDGVRVTVAMAGGLTNYGPHLAPVHVQHVETLKRLLVHALDYNLHGSTSDYHQYMLSVIYRAMVGTSAPVDQREQWVDDMLARVDRQCEHLRAGKDSDARPHYLANYMWLRFRAIELALSEGRNERARKLWDHARDLYQYQLPPEGSQLQWMRSVVTLADDAEWLAEFDRWHKELTSRVVTLLPVRFPQVNLHPKPADQSAAAIQWKAHRVSSLSFKALIVSKGRASTSVRPLAVGDGVLYVLLDIDREHGLLGAISLDETERPVGRRTMATIGGIQYEAWDGARLLPRPPFRGKYPDVAAVCHAHGKLSLATSESGLLVFDAGNEQWTAYGPDQGLPDVEVRSVASLDDHTVLCSSSRRKESHFTLDLADGTVHVLRTGDREQRISCPPLHGVWRNGKKLMGWDYGRLWTDLLAPGAHTQSCLDGKLAYGWQGKWDNAIEIRAMLQVAGRRFVAGPSGLHEFDPSGRVLRSWWSSDSISTEGPPVTVPPTSPGYGYNHVQAGLLIYSFHNNEAMAYRPETDTWYGPLPISADSAACGTRDGIWGAGFNGLGYVRNEDFTAKAKKVGRVMTTAEYLKRRDATIEAMLPSERAKVYFAMRRFDEAERLLKDVLKDEPEHAEALLLLGWLHDAWCTNRPDEARRYYGRLAAMEANPDACFSGLYMEFTMLKREKKWAELLELSDRICGRFPQINEHRQRSIDWWRDHAQKQVADEN